jgi:hypothetical protein
LVAASRVAVLGFLTDESCARCSVVPLANAEFLDERLPSSGTVFIDAGHFVWEEAPTEFASAVIDAIITAFCRRMKHYAVRASAREKGERNRELDRDPHLRRFRQRPAAT